MSDMNWVCCPLVAQNPTTRAFIEQLIKERKSPSTIENYSRDLNDFLSAFPDVPFPDLLEADETQIAHYVDWLWTRDAQRGSGHQADRSNITYLTGSKLAPATIRRRINLHIPQLTPHKMRHLMLTELKRSGMELLDVSRYARHHRITNTELYLHTRLSALPRQVN